MYYCNDCEAVFEDPDEWVELHSELIGSGGEIYERWGICPYCGSDGIEETDACDCCGEQDKLISVGTIYICRNCHKAMTDLLGTFTDEVMDRFNIKDTYDAKRFIWEFVDD